MGDAAMTSPYAPGNVLKVALHNHENTIIDAQVLRPLGNPTLSTVISIIVPGSAIGAEQPFACAALKISDRRFSPQLRTEEKTRPWSEEIEQRYRTFVTSGEAATFADKWFADDADAEEEDWESYSDEQNEAHLQCHSIANYEDEKKAYQQIACLQGDQFPMLYGSVTVACQSLPSVGGGTSSDHNMHDIPALLMEYIPGPTLEDLPVQIPRIYWQEVFETARQVAASYDNLGLLNKDVRLRNVIVRTPTSGDWSQSRVVMVVLAMSHIRADETDDEWREKKRMEAEEGGICVYMKRIVEEAGSALDFLYPTEKFWSPEKPLSCSELKRARRQFHTRPQARLVEMDESEIAELEDVASQKGSEPEKARQEREQKHNEQVQTERKQVEQEQKKSSPIEQKESEQKQSEQKQSEQKQNEQERTELKQHEQKQSEQKQSEQKQSEQKQTPAESNPTGLRVGRA